MEKLFYILLLLLNNYLFAQTTNILPNRIELARLTYAQILAIPSPQIGSICYDIDNNCVKVFDGVSWQCTNGQSTQTGATGVCSGFLNAYGGGFNTGASVKYLNSAAMNNELYEVGYVGGNGTVQFIGGGISVTSTSTTTTGIIAKFDANGAIVWLKSFANAKVKSLYTKGGEIYIIGTFSQTLSLTTTTGTATLTPVGSADVFVAKLDASGNIIWAKGYGGVGFDDGIDIAVDGTSAFITGNYSNAFVSGLPSQGLYDIFVLKIDLSNGNIQNSVCVGGSDNDWVNSIVVYKGIPIIVGQYSSMMNATNNVFNFNIPSPVGKSLFLLSFTSSLDNPSSSGINFTKWEGDDATDEINPIKATLENAYTNGIFNPVLKICANTVGTFPVSGQNITNGGFILTLNLATANPVLRNLITLQSGAFTAFNDGYAAGNSALASTNLLINGTLSIPTSSRRGFLLSTSTLGNYNWLIQSEILTNPSTGSPSSHGTTAISKICKKVFAAGSMNGYIKLCNSFFGTGTIKNDGYFWIYDGADSCN